MYYYMYILNYRNLEFNVSVYSKEKLHEGRPYTPYRCDQEMEGLLSFYSRDISGAAINDERCGDINRNLFFINSPNLSEANSDIEYLISFYVRCHMC